MKKNKFIYSQVIVIAPVLAVLVLFGYIGTYNRLLGDSLCSYYYAERLGLFRSIWYWRITWSGRYSAYGFDWLLSRIFSPQLIPFFIPITLLIWISVNFLFIYLFLKSKKTENLSILIPVALSTIVVFFSLTATPSIEQSFFWIDGFRAYTLPLIILSIYGVLYQISINHLINKNYLAVAVVITFTLFLLSGGLSETFAAVQILIMLFLILYFWLTEKREGKERIFFIFFSGLLGAIVAMLIVISAPGNTVRQSFFPPSPDFFKLMSISINGYMLFLKHMMPQKNIITVIGSMLFSVWAGSNYNGVFQFHWRKILLLVAGALVISFSCFPPGVYGYSEPPPDRVLSIAVFLICIMLMSASFIAGNFFKEISLINQKEQKVIYLFSVAILLTSSWMNFSSLYSAKDKYIEYAKVWDQTDTLIRQAKLEGKESVTVTPNASWAGLDLLNNNPKHWVNECYSFFYDIQVYGYQ